jgi:hypothetical protein
MTPQPREDLRGEALRRAWIDAGFAVPLRKEEPPVNVRALAIAISLAAVCWAIIGAGVWLVWRAF